MTSIQKRILKDLQIGPSNIDSIATRFGMTIENTKKELEELESKGRVLNRPLMHAPKITVWKST